MDPTNQGTTPSAGKSPLTATPKSVDSSTQTESLENFVTDASDAHESPDLRPVAKLVETPRNDHNSPLDAEKPSVPVPAITTVKKPAKPFSIDHLLSDAVGSSIRRKQPSPDPPLQVDLPSSPERKWPKGEQKEEEERKPAHPADNPFRIIARGATGDHIKRYRVQPTSLSKQQKLRPPPAILGVNHGFRKFHVVQPKKDEKAPPQKGVTLKAPMKVVLTTGKSVPKVPAQNAAGAGPKMCRFPASVPWKYRKGPETTRLRLVVGGQKAADKTSPSTTTAAPSKEPSSSQTGKPVVVKPLAAGGIRILRRVPPAASSATTGGPKTAAVTLAPSEKKNWSFPPAPKYSINPVASRPVQLPTAATVSPVKKIVKKILPPLLAQPSASLPDTATGATAISPPRIGNRLPTYEVRGSDADCSDISDESPVVKKPRVSPVKTEEEKPILSCLSSPRKKEKKEADLKGPWIVCSLCENQIMTSRLTNLINHAKRHCAVKQFSCVHCNYQHNEHHKVRMHMIGYHSEKHRLPKNNHNAGMERAWAMIVTKCFPKYGFHMQQNSKRLGADDHTCSECNEEVPPFFDSLRLHLTTKHPELCKCYRCTCCDYSNPDEGIVCWHVFKRHSHFQYPVDVVEKPFGSNMDVFLHKYFPSIDKCLPKPFDIEEERFMEQAVAVRFIWYLGTNGQRRPPTRPLISNEKGGESDEDEEEEVDVLLPFNYAPTPPRKEENKEGERLVKEEGDDDEEDEESLIEVDSERKEPSPTETEDSMDLGPLCKMSRPAVDRNNLGPNDLICELCEKVLLWTNKKSLAALLGHAKRHFRIKQYNCPLCNYCSSEAAHVRTHISRKHKERSVFPNENNDDFMQKSWIRVMKSCFPPLTDRINAFRFKTPKGNAVKYEDEEELVEEEPPVIEAPKHKYGTRRKKRLHGPRG